MIDITLILTKHAKQRMAEYAVNREQIKNVIKKGAKVKQTDGFLSSFGYLEAAYKIRGKKYIVKTVKIR